MFMRIAAAVYRMVEGAAWTVGLMAALFVTAAVALRYPGAGEAQAVASGAAASTATWSSGPGSSTPPTSGCSMRRSRQP